MSYYEDQPRLLWSSHRKVNAARKDHLDGCYMCGRIIRQGEAYYREVAMNDETMTVDTLRFHKRCTRSPV